MSRGSRGSIGVLYAEEGRSGKLDLMSKGVKMPKLPKSLNADEKQYLLAVERGDTASVRRMLQKVLRDGSMDINCMDPLGRGSLLMAIEAEQLTMVELLVVMGVKTADALLHAIDREFVEAVELLLEHEELVHKEGELYSWENVDRDTATFTPEITPLILAAHRNNYEIVKILLDRGATLPMPHDIRCGCNECIEGVRQDCLRHSASRINSYKALASPSLIALTSTDPLLTAFELSWELKQLSFSEPEFRGEYLELRKRSQEFAVSLLSHTRTSHELKVMLNFDPNIMNEDDESVAELAPTDIHECGLARLRLAINYKQKKFVAHSWVQQLLASNWYEGLPGFRQKCGIGKGLEVAKVIFLAPFYCLIYMFAPSSQTGRLIRKPFMKFLIQTSSYLFFLFLLILVSQRVEEQFVDWLDSMKMRNDPEFHFQRKPHRGNPPRILEMVVLMYIIGFIWEEARELVREGFRVYVSNMWNAIDFLRNSTYIVVVLLRAWAYIQQRQEIARDPLKAYIPREHWDDYDPQLIAEGLFAAANIFSALKLVHTSSINPHLGPLQISLGRMIVDILKFFFFYSLVLFAFACGLNQLLWYFADLEKDKCYSLPGGMPDWKSNSEACMKWRRFGNLFEASQSLFWASFGMVGLADFELTGIKSYTRFWGLLMFGSYSVINVIVLLNLLIAMMSNSYAMITEKADTEWKFARTKLWLSYFDEDSTLPSPFNLVPTPKQIKRLLTRIVPGGPKRKSCSKAREARLAELREQAREYTAVMRALVWRYISKMHRKKEEESIVTEDDVNEIKGEISTLRCDLAEMFRNNGMNVSGLAQKQASVSRKTREWERRLFRGFHVAPAAGDDSILLNVEAGLGQDNDGERRPSETGTDKFRRMARLALLNRDRLSRPPKHLSHIGRSTSNESFKSRQSLKLAMEAAKKMGEKSGPSPVSPPEPGQIVDDKKQTSVSYAKDRKDSTLSMVAESVRSLTPPPNSDEDDFTTPISDKHESSHDEGSPCLYPPPPPPPPQSMPIMDEPLPNGMNLIKATSPQKDLSEKLVLQTPSSPKLSELGPMSKSFPNLNAIPGCKPSGGNDTRILMENEKRGAESPITSAVSTPSRSVKSGSLDLGMEMTEQYKTLERQPTMEMDSLVISSASPTTRIDVSFIPTDEKEPVCIPFINVEQRASPSTVIPTVSAVVAGQPSPIDGSSSAIPPAESCDSPSTSSGTSGFGLLAAGNKLDDVKTIKRAKTGGSWF